MIFSKKRHICLILFCILLCSCSKDKEYNDDSTKAEVSQEIKDELNTFISQFTTGPLLEYYSTNKTNSMIYYITAMAAKNTNESIVSYANEMYGLPIETFDELARELFVVRDDYLDDILSVSQVTNSGDIYKANGKVIFQSGYQSGGGQIEIDSAELKAGIYSVEGHYVYKLPTTSSKIPVDGGNPYSSFNALVQLENDGTFRLKEFQMK